eukprot:714235-Rhodomonas_salina.1
MQSYELRVGNTHTQQGSTRSEQVLTSAVGPCTPCASPASPMSPQRACLHKWQSLPCEIQGKHSRSWYSLYGASTTAASASSTCSHPPVVSLHPPAGSLRPLGLRVHPLGLRVHPLGLRLHPERVWSVVADGMWFRNGG